MSKAGKMLRVRAECVAKGYQDGAPTRCIEGLMMRSPEVGKGLVLIRARDARQIITSPVRRILGGDLGVVFVETDNSVYRIEEHKAWEDTSSGLHCI